MLARVRQSNHKIFFSQCEFTFMINTLCHVLNLPKVSLLGVIALRGGGLHVYSGRLGVIVADFCYLYSQHLFPTLNLAITFCYFFKITGNLWKFGNCKAWQCWEKSCIILSKFKFYILFVVIQYDNARTSYSLDNETYL